MGNPIIDATLQRLPGRWHQGNYGDGNGNFCLYGHMTEAVGELVELGDNDWHQATSALGRLITGHETYIDFNDDPHTSEEDVILLLKRANEWLDENRPAS